MNLGELYSDIHNCRKCSGVIPCKVARQVVEGAGKSKIVLMGQAPSENGVRITGYHWVGLNNRKKSSTTFLDDYLKSIGYSIDPSSRLIRPYTTNVLHCWTGKKGQRDRKPSREELITCRYWWLKEFKLINPNIILLLGKVAAESFSSARGDQRRFFELLRCQGEQNSFEALTFYRFVVPHPAAAYPNKSQIYKDVFTQIGHILK